MYFEVLLVWKVTATKRALEGFCLGMRWHVSLQIIVVEKSSTTDTAIVLILSVMSFLVYSETSQFVINCTTDVALISFKSVPFCFNLCPCPDDTYRGAFPTSVFHPDLLSSYTFRWPRKMTLWLQWQRYNVVQGSEHYPLCIYTNEIFKYRNHRPVCLLSRTLNCYTSSFLHYSF